MPTRGTRYIDHLLFDGRDGFFVLGVRLQDKFTDALLGVHIRNWSQHREAATFTIYGVLAGGKSDVATASSASFPEGLKPWGPEGTRRVIESFVGTADARPARLEIPAHPVAGESLSVADAVFLSLLTAFRALARSRAALHLETLALRHQLLVLGRSRRLLVHLTPGRPPVPDRVLADAVDGHCPDAETGGSARSSAVARHATCEGETRNPRAEDSLHAHVCLLRQGLEAGAT